MSCDLVLAYVDVDVSERDAGVEVGRSSDL